MKVLAIGPTGGLSGVDKTLESLCIGLVQRGNKVVAVLPRNAEIRKSLVNAGVIVEESPYLGWWFNPAFNDNHIGTVLAAASPSVNHLVNLINKIRPDVVISNTSVFLDGLMAARISGIPHVVHFHALFVDNIYTEMSPDFKSSIYRLLIDGQSSLVTPSYNLKKHLVKEEGLDESKISVISNGVDTDFFIPLINKNERERKHFILSLGHFNANKNQILLVEVARLLRRKQVNNFIFRLVGPPEVEYLSELKRLIKKEGLEAQFEILGQRNDVLTLLQEATIYVNCSKTETFPVSLLEAMAVGLPSVCTPTVGAREIVEDGKTGYIADNAEDMASQIMDLLSDPTARAVIGENARARVLDNYSSASFVDGFAAVLEVVRQKATGSAEQKWLQTIFFRCWEETCSVQKNKVAVLVPDRSQTSFILLVEKPFQVIKESLFIGFDVFSCGEISNLKLEEYDLLYVFRLYTDPVSSIIEKANAACIPVIFETDDNYFALKFENGEPCHGNTENLELAAVITKSDKIVVYSEPMQKAAQKYNNNVVRFKPYQLFPDQIPLLHDQKLIGFMGSLKKDIDFDFVTPALKRLLSEDENLRIEFFGFVPNDLAAHPRIFQSDFNSDYDLFIREFWKRGWKVALAPLADTEFNRSKTNNKYREYAAAGYAGVYSDIGPYRESVVHNKTGILVKNVPDAWYEAIVTLMADASRRANIVCSAFEDVKKKFDFESHVKKKSELIQHLMTTSVRSRRERVVSHFRNSWYPVHRGNPWRVGIDLTRTPYASLVVPDFDGVLAGINVVVLDFIDSPETLLGVEIVLNDRIMAHLTRSAGTLRRGSLIDFGFRPIVGKGSLEVRVFAKAPVGPVVVMGGRSLWPPSKFPMLGLVFQD